MCVVCVCVFNQTVKAGKKLILGWSCDSNIKHMGKIETKKKAAFEACGCLSQRGPPSRVAVHLFPESLHKGFGYLHDLENQLEATYQH